LTRSDPTGIGIDVALAIEPALETVRGFGGHPRCEVAAWSASQGHSRRLAIPGARIWCHWLDERDYRAVEDLTDYAKPWPPAGVVSGPSTSGAVARGALPGGRGRKPWPQRRGGPRQPESGAWAVLRGCPAGAGVAPI